MTEGTGVRAAALAAAFMVGLVCVPSALSAAPANDHFANAQVISGETGTTTGTNDEATKEEGEPSHAGDPGGASVWFRWMAPRSGVLVLDTCDSDFDTLLAVYVGPAVNSLTPIAANDDACDLQSGLELDVTGGTEYRIAVDGAGGDTGTISLFYGMAPPNDDFSAAAGVTAAVRSVPGSTFLASHELGEPRHAGEPGTGSVWYQWTPPEFGDATFDTCATSSDTLLAVYTGSSVGSLREIASSGDVCGQASKATFQAQKGVVYWIAVDGFTDYVNFVLSWSLRPFPPRNFLPPEVTGSPVEDGTLTATRGSWLYETSLTYSWRSCPATESTITINCSFLSFLSSSVFKIPASTVGRRIGVVVTASGPGGSSSAFSGLTAPVASRAPINTTPPTVAGFAQVGQTLSAGEGQWNLGSAPRLDLTYAWERCDPTGANCRPISGQRHENSYVLTVDDRGATVRAVVTMTNAGGSASAASITTEIIESPAPSPRRRVCGVPRITGKTLTVARRMLTRSRCRFRVGRVQRVWSARKRGVIIRQRPRAGTRLRVGGRVNVVLSKGRRR